MEKSNLTLDIQAAQRRLIGRFEEFNQEFCGGRAWGFSLDPSTTRGQVGIYGTVAAVEILIMAGYAIESPLVAGGLKSLREGFPDKKYRWYQKHDFDTTLKRAWMARLGELGKAAKAHREWLVSTQLHNLGWRAYTAVDKKNAGGPDFISTCFALIGLADYTSYVATHQAAGAARWILAQVGDVNRQPVADLALAVIAVTTFGHFDDDLREKVNRFITPAARCLRAFVKRREPERTPFFQDYRHFIGEPPQTRREPFQVPVELAVLNALIRTNDAENIRACRSAIRRLTSSIIDAGGVEVNGQFRTETQFWAAKVLFGLDGRATRILSRRWVPWRNRDFMLLGLAFLLLLMLTILNASLDTNPASATGLWALARRTLEVLASPLAVVMELVLIALLAVWRHRE